MLLPLSINCTLFVRIWDQTTNLSITVCIGNILDWTIIISVIRDVHTRNWHNKFCFRSRNLCQHSWNKSCCSSTNVRTYSMVRKLVARPNAKAQVYQNTPVLRYRTLPLIHYCTTYSTPILMQCNACISDGVLRNLFKVVNGWDTAVK